MCKKRCNLSRPLLETSWRRFRRDDSPRQAYKRLATLVMRQGSASYGHLNVLDTFLHCPWMTTRNPDLLQTAEDWFVTADFRDSYYNRSHQGKNTRGSDWKVRGGGPFGSMKTSVFNKRNQGLLHLFLIVSWDLPCYSLQFWKQCTVGFPLF